MITYEENKEALSPQEVREILNTNNREIITLCKQAAIVPRKNPHGQVYFSQDEVKTLRSVANSQRGSQLVVDTLVERLQSMESSICSSLSKTLDEKLDGMDEVVVELISTKTENETLRQKINELNKENYSLKSRLNNFKSLGFGIYLKKEGEDFLI